MPQLEEMGTGQLLGQISLLMRFSRPASLLVSATVPAVIIGFRETGQAFPLPTQGLNSIAGVYFPELPRSLVTTHLEPQQHTGHVRPLAAPLSILL